MSVFFDTNILIYADDADAGAKTGLSRDLLRQAMIERAGAVSTQILQEFYVNATKKLGLEGSAARARVEVYLNFDVVIISPGLLLAAVDLHRMEPISFWDALVVRAATQAGCHTLYSEDLQHGRRYGPVTVVNPFV